MKFLNAPRTRSIVYMRGCLDANDAAASAAAAAADAGDVRSMMSVAVCSTRAACDAGLITADCS